MRVVVGLSGGVDSSVAAARVRAEGHEVTGVHLAMARASTDGTARGCAVPGAVEDAERVAEHLGIDFEVWDFGAEFRQQVGDYFLDEYAQGRTPNPCLRCNATIKFTAFLERARERGFDALATGHYARVEHTDGMARLHRAHDGAKDQSYVLGVLTQAQLRHVLFPLAGTPKAAVRAEAAALGLSTASKPDSLDICFIPDGDTAGYLRDRLGAQPGAIVDADGTVLGTHEGAFQFTVGQRKGLRLGRPAPDGQPRYVLGVDPVRSTVVVGPRAALAVRTLTAIRPTWTVTPRVGTWRGDVQFRAHGAPLPATLTASDDRVHVVFDEPTHGVAPGQGAVFYDGDEVIGAATIDATAA